MYVYIYQFLNPTEILHYFLFLFLFDPIMKIKTVKGVWWRITWGIYIYVSHTVCNRLENDD